MYYMYWKDLQGGVNTMIQNLVSYRVFSSASLLGIETVWWKRRDISRIKNAIYASIGDSRNPIIVCQGPLLLMIAKLILPGSKLILHIHNHPVYDSWLVQLLTYAAGLVSYKLYFVSPGLKNHGLFPFLLMFKKYDIVSPLWNIRLPDKLNNSFLMSCSSGGCKRPAVLISTRWHPTKNIEYLIEYYSKHNPECDVYILSDSDMISAMVAHVSCNRIFYADYSHSKFNQLAGKCQFILSLSRQEGFCLSLLEGMSHGLIPLAPLGSCGPSYIIDGAPYPLAFRLKCLDSLLYTIHYICKDASRYRAVSDWSLSRSHDLHQLSLMKWKAIASRY